MAVYIKRFTKFFFLFLLSSVIYACSPDESVWVDLPVDTQEPLVLNTGSTQVREGAETIDLILSANGPKVVYYALFNAEPDDKSPEGIRGFGLGNTLSPTVIRNGVVELTGEDGSDLDVVTLENLDENTQYFAYLISENPLENTLQGNAESFEVKTVERQVVSQFQSSVESRQVLFLVYQHEESLKYPEAKHPAIIFLGGHGETASQGEINLIRNGSLPEYLDKGNDVPMMVFSPQHIRNNWNINMINEMVEEVKANYPVDPDRIYMTGISGGGIATWNFIAGFPNQIAAAIPISGNGNTNTACNMKDIPVWAFHNEPDGMVGTAGSVNMVNAINACDPPAQAKLTLFEDQGHNAWRRVYDPGHANWNLTEVAPVDIYSWFLEFSK